MKKLISGMLALVMIFSLVCLLPQNSDLFETASAEYNDSSRVGDFGFSEMIDGTLMVTNYYGTSTSISVPNTADGKKVTAVASFIPTGLKDSVTTITLPKNVTKIGAYAFDGLSALKKVTINGSVTEVGPSAFYNCKKLTTISLPKTVKTIGPYAFYGCSSLTSFVVPENVTTIENYTFYNCTALANITFGSKVKEFRYGAFSGTKWLTNQRNKYSSHLVLVNGVLVDGVMYASKSLTIPSNVTAIADDAFYGNNTITSVTVPKTAKSIGTYAFAYCRSLSSVSIASSVTHVGYNAFASTPWLTNKQKSNPLVVVNGILIDAYTTKGAVKVPSTVKTIGEGAFRYNNNVTSVSIPSSVKLIEDGAFYSCGKLKTATISSGVTTIGTEAFNNCAALETCTLPSSVKTIGDRAFYYCTALKQIVIPSSVTSIGDYAYYYCKNATKITLPKTAIKVGNYAFNSCSSVTSLTVPAKATLGDYCFAYMSALKTLTFESGRTNLGFYSFSSNNSLTDVTLPASLKTIDVGAFYYSGSLKSIYLPKNLESIKAYAFSSCSNLEKVFTHANLKSISPLAFYYLYRVNLKCEKGSYPESYAKINGLNYSYYELASNRIYGNNRYSTASTIASYTNPYSSTNLVIASGTSFADALAGVPLAKTLNAPILLSGPSGLDNNTIMRIKVLRPKNVYILGGTGAVPAKVVTQLTSLGIESANIKRISGSTRHQTAVNIAKQIATLKDSKKITKVFIAYANDFPDALSASAAAAVSSSYSSGTAILYVGSKGKFEKETTDYLNSIKSDLTNIYVIGGTGVIPSSAVTTLQKYCSNVKRLGGANRYSTCVAVNEEFSSYFTSDTICIVTGKNFPDALAAGVYAANNGSALFLADQSLNADQTKYLKKKGPTLMTAIGGTGVVPAAIITKISAAIKSGW